MTDIYKVLADAVAEAYADVKYHYRSSNVGWPREDPELRPSHRPDLSDLQVSLKEPARRMARESGLYGPATFSPEIARIMTASMSSNPELAGIEYTFDIGSGDVSGSSRRDDPRGHYLNIRFSDQFLVTQVQAIAGEASAVQTVPGNAGRQKILIDYGSPNIGKAMHVGHIRSGVIGQALHNLAERLGHTVIADSHLGDWGQPMGMIIAELRSRFPQWACFREGFKAEDGFQIPISSDGAEGTLSISELNAVYPAASQKAKNDQDFQAKVRETTANLQSGKHPECTALWQAFRDVSLQQVDSTYEKLGVAFDRAHGESAYHQEIGVMIAELTARGLVERNEENELVMNVDRASLINALSRQGIIRRHGDSWVVDKDKEHLVTDIAGPDFLERNADGTLRRVLHDDQLKIAPSRTQMIENLKAGGVLKTDGDNNLVIDLQHGSRHLASLREQGLLVRQDEDVLRNRNGEPIIDPNKMQDPVIRPLKLQTADGSYTYGASDLAAIRRRVREDGPDSIWYVVDKRQGPHFEQVFRASRIADYTKNTRLEHLPFGTYNGPDGKPFRTRAGGVMSLDHMLESAEDEVRRNCAVDDGKVAGLAASSLIFNDLINNRKSDVTFLPEQLLKFGGKSVASVEYAYSHLNSLLQKPVNHTDSVAASLDVHSRRLAVLLLQKEERMQRAFDLRNPNILTEYLYDVSRAFDRLYRELDPSQGTVAAFTASLAKASQATMQDCAAALGITLTGDVQRKAEEHTKDISAINKVFEVSLPAESSSQPIATAPIPPEEFDAFKRKCERLADLLEAKQPELVRTLQIYEPASTAEDEINLACRCLRDLEQYRENFTDKIPKVAALLHANLPIYYYVVLGVMPSLMAKEVHMRPNQHMQDKKVIEALSAVQIDPDNPDVNLFNYFDNITMHTKMGRDQFFATHLATCDYGIVNGSYEAGHELTTKYMKPGAVLVSEGKHHDPFIVTSTADIPKAVERAVHLKAYNGGQECAAPDAILVDESVAEEFIRQFKEAYFRLKVEGSYEDPDTGIGPPAAGEADLKHTAEFLKKFREAHPHVPIDGGTIDWDKGVINPTVIVSKLGDMSVPPNYEELFNPIQFIHTYKNTGELRRYFSDERYGVNKGYISLFCDENAEEDKIRDWILHRNDDGLHVPTEQVGRYEEDRYGIMRNYKLDRYGIGRVIVNGSIHNLLQDEPLAPFGGYSAASFIMRMRQSTAPDGREEMIIDSRCLPISHSEIIRDYIVQKKVVYPQGKTPALAEAHIPDLIGIKTDHALLGLNTVEIAAAYPDPHLKGEYVNGNAQVSMASPPVSAVYFLDQAKLPDSAAQGQARGMVERALAQHNSELGNLTFVTTDYVRRELAKTPSYSDASEQLVRAVLALNGSLDSREGRLDGDVMVADELREIAAMALKRWKRNILQKLPYGDSGDAYRIKVLAQKSAAEVVGMAINADASLIATAPSGAEQVSAPTASKLAIPHISLGDSGYHLSGVEEGDYEGLLKIAQTPGFLFAPLNGRRNPDGSGRMPLADIGGMKGSVRRYIEEAAEVGNYVFLIRAPKTNIVVGAIELIGVERKGDGYEAEIGMFIEPAHQKNVPLNRALTNIMQWANANLGVNSLRATTDPGNRSTSKVIESLRKVINIASISPEESAYTDLGGELRPRNMYLIPPVQLATVLARGGVPEADEWAGGLGLASPQHSERDVG